MPTFPRAWSVARRTVRRFTYGYRDRFVQFMVALMLSGGLFLQASLAQGTSPPVRIVAFGDSLTAGYLLPARAAFPAVLERSLRAAGYNVEIVNAGVSGDTSTGGLDRLEWAIGDGADAIILELGANDMLRGLDPEVTYRSLKEIIVRAKAKGLKVLIAGMLADPSLGKEYQQPFNEIFPRLAQETSSPLYPFFLEGVLTDRSLVMPDGLHPTAAGVEKIVAGILPLAIELVKSVSPRS